MSFLDKFNIADLLGLGDEEEDYVENDGTSALARQSKPERPKKEERRVEPVESRQSEAQPRQRAQRQERPVQQQRQAQPQQRQQRPNPRAQQQRSQGIRDEQVMAGGRQERRQPVVNGNSYTRMERPQNPPMHQKPARREREKVVPLQTNNTNTQNNEQSATRNYHKPVLAIKEPRVYSDAQSIGKLVLQDDAVLVNFHLMDDESAGRIIDFLTGVVYAIDGDIQRVSGTIFLCSQKGVEITSDNARSLLHDTDYDLF
jgi:FtsZ-interacting cell division protein YlmF